MPTHKQHPAPAKAPAKPAYTPEPAPNSNPKFFAVLSPGIHREPDGDDYKAMSEQDSVRQEIPGAVTTYLSNDLKDGAEAKQAILDKIRAHIKANGPLDQLQIGSHGGPQLIAMGNEDWMKADTRVFGLKEFLGDIAKLQTELQSDPEYKAKYGDAKIAGRMVFMGCDLFTDLEPKDVEFYRQQAKSMGIDIVGNRSTQSDTEHGPEARRVIFGHDGNIGIDRTDKPSYRDSTDSHSGAWLDQLQAPSTPKLPPAPARTPQAAAPAR